MSVKATQFITVTSRTVLNLLFQLLLLVALPAGCASVTPDLVGTTIVLKAERKAKPKEEERQESQSTVKKGPHTYEVFGKTYEVMEESLGYLEIGVASWYGKKFHGRLTSNGESYDMYAMTAAHKSLPLPTVVRVTNLDNGQAVVLRVNDRGPFHDDRLIDLSFAAAKKLGFENQGTAPVVVEAIDEINYPELALSLPHETYYLQVGAFSRRQGAEMRMQQVKDALPSYLKVKILMSGQVDGSVLHKVWIGPMESLREEQLVEARIVDRNLGKPVRVAIGSE